MPSTKQPTTCFCTWKLWTCAANTLGQKLCAISLVWWMWDVSSLVLTQNHACFCENRVWCFMFVFTNRIKWDIDEVPMYIWTLSAEIRKSAASSQVGCFLDIPCRHKSSSCTEKTPVRLNIQNEHCREHVFFVTRIRQSRWISFRANFLAKHSTIRIESICRVYYVAIAFQGIIIWYAIDSESTTWYVTSSRIRSWDPMILRQRLWRHVWAHKQTAHSKHPRWSFEQKRQTQTHTHTHVGC